MVAIIVLTVGCFVGAVLYRTLSGSSCQNASTSSHHLAAMVTAMSSLIHMGVALVGLADTIQAFVALSVVTIPLLSFAVELGLWTAEGQRAVWHHVLGILGSWYFVERAQGKYVAIIAFLLVDSVTDVTLAWLGHRRSRLYLLFWLLVRCAYYPGVLLVYTVRTYRIGDIDICCFLVIWLLFSSLWHAKKAASLARYHW